MLTLEKNLRIFLDLVYVVCRSRAINNRPYVPRFNASRQNPRPYKGKPPPPILLR